MKTAVDYLVEQYEQQFGFSISILMQKQVQQAKEMEKQQIIEARVTAPIIAITNKEDYYTEAENYYQETYGK